MTHAYNGRIFKAAQVDGLIVAGSRLHGALLAALR